MSRTVFTGDTVYFPGIDQIDPEGLRMTVPIELGEVDSGTG